MLRSDVVIVGGGITGLSVAFHLGLGEQKSWVLFEKSDQVGGICGSVTTSDGFTFDYASHLLFTKDPYAEDLIKKVLGEDLLTENRRAWIYSKRVYTRYPFQANMYGLPVNVVKDCLVGLIKATYEKTDGDPINFEEWLYATFGAGITKHFMLTYNRKQWGIDPKEMNFDWIKGRVLTPPIEDAITGALTDQKKGFGPNSVFWYPKTGGVGALPEAMSNLLDDAKVELRSEVKEIHWQEKRVRLSSSKEYEYSALVYTAPLCRLPEMMVPGLPSEVLAAVNRLEYNVIYCVNLAVKREQITDKQRIYLPEEKYLLHRVGFPTTIAPSMAPPGWSSIYAEIAESQYKSIPKGDELVQRVIADLKNIGIIRDDDHVELKSILVLDPAYVIYTHTHRHDVDLIHDFLKDNDILPCGRFGDWEYFNVDKCIMSGKRVAERILANGW